MNELGEYKGYEIFFNPEGRDFLATKPGIRLSGRSYSALCKKIVGKSNNPSGDIDFSHKLKGEEVTMMTGRECEEGHLTGHIMTSRYYRAEVRLPSGKERWASHHSLFMGHVAAELRKAFKLSSEAQRKTADLRERYSSNGIFTHL